MADNPRGGSSSRANQAAQPAGRPGQMPIAIVGEAETALGRLELRRRWSLALECDVFEILLDGNLVMSSAVHASEDALATRALAASLKEDLSVLVGGLGLGYTLRQVLADRRVRSVAVVELLGPLVAWHAEGLLPGTHELLNDARVALIEDDFFQYLARPATAETSFDMILIDIDDGPEHTWHESHAGFYSPQGLLAAIEHLRPGGVLAFWFATRPKASFLQLLGGLVSGAKVETIAFDDPSLHAADEHFIVLGHRPQDGEAIPPG